MGDDDVAAGTVGVNRRSWPKPEKGVPLATFIDEVTAEVERKGLPEDRAPEPAATTDGATNGAR